MPASPSRPLPSSHTAGGSGTALTAAIAGRWRSGSAYRCSCWRPSRSSCRRRSRSTGSQSAPCCGQRAVAVPAGDVRWACSGPHRPAALVEAPSMEFRHSWCRWQVRVQRRHLGVQTRGPGAQVVVVLPESCDTSCSRSSSRTARSQGLDVGSGRAIVLELAAFDGPVQRIAGGIGIEQRRQVRIAGQGQRRRVRAIREVGDGDAGVAGVGRDHAGSG